MREAPMSNVRPEDDTLHGSFETARGVKYDENRDPVSIYIWGQGAVFNYVSKTSKTSHTLETDRLNAHTFHAVPEKQGRQLF